MREPQEEKEVPQLALVAALLTLGISTAFVGICAYMNYNGVYSKKS